MTNRVLVVEDEAAIRLAVSRLLKKEGYEVDEAGSGDDAIEQIKEHFYDLIITDNALGKGPSGMDVLEKSRALRSETPVVMITAHGNEKIAVEAMKKGATDYVPKPFDNDEIRLVVRRALERTRLEREHRLLLERIEKEYGFGAIIGSGPAMQRIFETIKKVAETDLTVLVRGESGTGKELVAQALHHRSPRRSRPFIAVNCAAISRELVESELFGHEKGAFTGSNQYSDAITLYLKTDSIYSSNSYDGTEVGMVYENLSNVFNVLNDSSSLSFINKAINHYKKNSNTLGINRSLMFKGDFFLRQGEYKKAISNLET
ncbi:MAG: sigma 54-interacting transcriptional regulator, partial [Myxococcota bacterium]